MKKFTLYVIDKSIGKIISFDFNCIEYLIDFIGKDKEYFIINNYSK